VLAIDTATDHASVALYDGTRVRAERTWLAGRNHSRTVLVEVAAAMALGGWVGADVAAVSGALGPGSFTGVRVGLSLAEGLAFAWGVPLYGFTTLEVAARAAGPCGLPVRALVGLGRDRFATALFRDGQPVEPVRGVAARELADLADVPQVVVGDGAAALGALAETHPRWMVASPAVSLRRAGLLAELGWAALAAGRPGLERIEPIYLGGSVPRPRGAPGG
jgi:tRNA threonylcarbamoyladenosine biosynthesis protein TsaB